MGVIKWGGKLRARGDISIGGSAVLFGASEDTTVYRSAAGTLQLGSGDTMRFAVGTGVTGTECRMVLPHSTAAGTGFPSNNGEVVVTQRAAGSPVICVRLNGTNYYTALTAA